MRKTAKKFLQFLSMVVLAITFIGVDQGIAQGNPYATTDHLEPWARLLEITGMYAEGFSVSNNEYDIATGLIRLVAKEASSLEMEAAIKLLSRWGAARWSETDGKFIYRYSNYPKDLKNDHALSERMAYLESELLRMKLAQRVSFIKCLNESSLSAILMLYRLGQRKSDPGRPLTIDVQLEKAEDLAVELESFSRSKAVLGESTFQAKFKAEKDVNRTQWVVRFDQLRTDLEYALEHERSRAEWDSVYRLARARQEALGKIRGTERRAERLGEIRKGDRFDESKEKVPSERFRIRDLVRRVKPAAVK
jgi:hypothetical protein